MTITKQALKQLIEGLMNSFTESDERGDIK